MAPTLKLTGPMRAILRSRFIRHVDAVLIAQHMQGAFGLTSTSQLAVAQCLELADKFNVSIPSRATGEAYDAYRKQGLSARQAMAKVEAQEVAAGVQLSNIRAPDADLSVAGGGSLADDTDDESAPAEAAEAAEAAEEAEAEDPAEVDVRAVLKPFGRGDMAGFKAGLLALAVRANKPAVALPSTYDASRAHGHVAQLVRHASLKEVNLPAPLLNASEDATRMAVYDGKLSPAKDPDYAWPDSTAAIVAQMRRGRNVFLTGPAGVGKTSFCEQLAAYYGREYVRISCDDQTEAATLVGMTVPSADGGSRFQDGQLAAAIRKPGALVLVDEPSLARAGALFVLQAVLDADRRLHVAETGEVIPVAPDVLFVLADNTNGTGDATGQHEGTRIINRATLDRCAITLPFTYLDNATETKVLQKRTKCTAALASQLVKFASLTRTSADDGSLRYGIGMRRLIALAEVMTDGAGASFAFNAAVLATSTHDDAERLRQIWTSEFNAAAAGVKA